MKIGVILMPLLVLINGCYNPVADDNSSGFECNKDSDCALAGCSSQLCVSAEKTSEIMTTCEYREEYSCLKLTNCGCTDNKCMWGENEAYLNCMEGVRS